MIPVEQVEQKIAEAVAAAIAATAARVTAEYEQAMRELLARLRPLEESLAQAKQLIAKLQAQLYGTKAETSRVVLTSEGQQFIDATWGVSQETTPAPAEPENVTRERETETVVRRARDRRGLAQRYPQLRLDEVDAPLPIELAEQVANGALIARRSGRHHDELVAPTARAFLRRIHEIELIKAAGNHVVVQVAPDRIVPDGDLADETIHRFIEGKFLDAIPFHRQLAQLNRVGVDLAKQTVNDAANAWGDVFAPLAQAIRAQILSSEVVHADASWSRVQAPGACERVHLWTVLGGGQVSYSITGDLKHERASELIPADFAGRLVTDAWPGWLKLPLGQRLGLCNAHARRPFADWLKRKPDNPHARQFIALYRELANAEHDAKDGPPNEIIERRQRIRTERSRMIMEKILAHARETLAAYGPAHQLGDGAKYIIDHWNGLSRFLDDPHLPTDNNAAENALRINALIRKNSMFSGSHAAAHRDATALTILHTCRLAHLNPADYLARVTPTLLLHRRGRPQNLTALTPAAVKEAQQPNKPS